VSFFGSASFLFHLFASLKTSLFLLANSANVYDLEFIFLNHFSYVSGDSLFLQFFVEKFHSFRVDVAFMWTEAA